MSDRREFFRQAGILATVPWSKASSARTIKSSEGAQPLSQAEAQGLVLENDEIRLVINPGGWAQSLIHKPSGQQCLATEAQVPMFRVTQYRPYDNELQLAYPAKVTHFPAQQVRREGDRLIVSFALVGYEGTIGVKVSDAYIAFHLEQLEYKGYTQLRPKRKTRIDETLFVQLPVRNRKNLGGWLNVMWDDDVAVNLLATDYHTRIDAQPCQNFHLFQGGTTGGVDLLGGGAAIIVTTPSELLSRIARVEEGFNLPRGVKSRRCKEYKYSYYEMSNVTPSTIDRHIRYAKMGGFRMMQVYYLSFAQTVGHFDWRPDYPNRMRDLQGVVQRISEAGIVPGIHIHYDKCHKTDAYVTPKPDPRLNLRHSYTLTAPIDAQATVVPVEENPHLCTMEDGRRILRIQNELITYEHFTTMPPYQFKGCVRGALGTEASAHLESSRVGLLDVDTWPIFVRFTQNTSIQQEVAERLGKIYHDAGFRYVYFDGAEDVPVPYWFTVSRAQLLVYEQFNPKPLLAEGACKSHFSWHLLTRGNAFDVFLPEVMKAAIRAYPAAEIPRVEKDFTKIDFGWIGYWIPSEKTIGTQPDMLEYVTSRAAGWECPASFNADLKALDEHPRTPDNLEVFRRWEDVRASDWLTAEQKNALRNLNQEHTLLVNEQGKFELVPYDQIEKVAGVDKPGRAFVFERSGTTYVVFWNTSGEGKIEIPLGERQVRLMKELGKPVKFKGGKISVTLPLAGKMYLECRGVSRQEAIAAFRKGRIF